MVDEIDAAYGVREEIEDGKRDEAPIEAVGLVEGAYFLCGGGVVVDGAGAQEAAETGAGDV